MASVAVAQGKSVAVNRVRELLIAEYRRGRPQAGGSARRKALTLRVEIFKFGAPVARFVVRSGFGQRMRTRLETQDQTNAVEMYNSIK